MKFSNPEYTLDGTPRAVVPFENLETLWFNTGTRCNLSCDNCYIESNPRNDRLSFLKAEDVEFYLNEIKREGLSTGEIGFTGGEPFLNPHMIDLIQVSLQRGFHTLVLTNAYRMDRVKEQLKELARTYGDQLNLRVSLDHFDADIHERERGPNTFSPTLKNIQWLLENNIKVSIAGRSLKSEPQSVARRGYEKLFKDHNIAINAFDAIALTIFPEMDNAQDVPEITSDCWGILNKEPSAMMCSKSRMVVKRKGEANCKVLSCTLLAYDPQFQMGSTLKESFRKVSLNHKFCAQFCVLGGASCS